MDREKVRQLLYATLGNKKSAMKFLFVFAKAFARNLRDGKYGKISQEELMNLEILDQYLRTMDVPDELKKGV